jgi:hypothetical protein
MYQPSEPRKEKSGFGSFRARRSTSGGSWRDNELFGGISVGGAITIALITWRVYRITRPFRAVADHPPAATAPLEVGHDDDDDDHDDDAPPPAAAGPAPPPRQRGRKRDLPLNGQEEIQGAPARPSAPAPGAPAQPGGNPAFPAQPGDRP